MGRKTGVRVRESQVSKAADEKEASTRKRGRKKVTDPNGRRIEGGEGQYAQRQVARY